MAEEPPRRRRDVPKLHVGLLVRVGENCRSAVLKGKQGTVVSVGRQVEVQLVGLEDDPKGCVRFINPTDLVPVDEAGSTDATVPSVQSRGLSWKVRPIGSGAQETPPTDEQVFEAASAPAAGAVQLRSGRGDGSTKEKLPTLEPGARIRVSESCRTVALRGRAGTVTDVGRQVVVHVDGLEDDPKGATRKLDRSAIDTLDAAEPA